MRRFVTVLIALSMVFGSLVVPFIPGSAFQPKAANAATTTTITLASLEVKSASLMVSSTVVLPSGALLSPYSKSGSVNLETLKKYTDLLVPVRDMYDKVLANATIVVAATLKLTDPATVSDVKNLVLKLEYGDETATVLMPETATVWVNGSAELLNDSGISSAKTSTVYFVAEIDAKEFINERLRGSKLYFTVVGNKDENLAVKYGKDYKAATLFSPKKVTGLSDITDQVYLTKLTFTGKQLDGVVDGMVGLVNTASPKWVSATLAVDSSYLVGSATIYSDTTFAWFSKELIGKDKETSSVALEGWYAKIKDIKAGLANKDGKLLSVNDIVTSTDVIGGATVFFMVSAKNAVDNDDLPEAVTATLRKYDGSADGSAVLNKIDTTYDSNTGLVNYAAAVDISETTATVEFGFKTIGATHTLGYVIEKPVKIYSNDKVGIIIKQTGIDYPSTGTPELVYTASFTYDATIMKVATSAIDVLVNGKSVKKVVKISPVTDFNSKYTVKIPFDKLVKGENTIKISLVKEYANAKGGFFVAKVGQDGVYKLVQAGVSKEVAYDLSDIIWDGLKGTSLKVTASTATKVAQTATVFVYNTEKATYTLYAILESVSEVKPDMGLKPLVQVAANGEVISLSLNETATVIKDFNQLEPKKFSVAYLMPENGSFKVKFIVKKKTDNGYIKIDSKEVEYKVNGYDIDSVCAVVNGTATDMPKLTVGATVTKMGVVVKDAEGTVVNNAYVEFYLVDEDGNPVKPKDYIAGSTSTKSLLGSVDSTKTNIVGGKYTLTATYRFIKPVNVMVKVYDKKDGNLKAVNYAVVVEAAHDIQVSIEPVEDLYYGLTGTVKIYVTVPADAATKAWIADVVYGGYKDVKKSISKQTATVYTYVLEKKVAGPITVKVRTVDYAHDGEATYSDIKKPEVSVTGVITRYINSSYTFKVVSEKYLKEYENKYVYNDKVTTATEYELDVLVKSPTQSEVSWSFGLSFGATVPVTTGTLPVKDPVVKIRQSGGSWITADGAELTYINGKIFLAVKYLTADEKAIQNKSIRLYSGGFKIAEQTTDEDGIAYFILTPDNVYGDVALYFMGDDGKYHMLANVKVEKDTVGPTVELTQPNVENGGSITVTDRSSEYMIAGNVTDIGSGVKAVYIKGVVNGIVRYLQEATVLGDTFYARIQLLAGEQTIVIEAFDNQGNKSIYTFTINYEPANKPPVVTLYEPANIPNGGIYTTSQSQVALSFRVTDEDTGVGAVTLNGKFITLDPLGFYMSNVELKEGKNVFTIVAYDKEDPEEVKTTYTFTIEYKVPPVIEITSPADITATITTDKPELTIEGKATDVGSGVAKVTVNGTPVLVAEDGTFKATVELDETKINEIVVTAVDKAGYETSKTIVVVFKADPTIDELNVSNTYKQEEDTYYTYYDEVKLTGKVSDVGAGVDKVKVNGSEVEVAEDGTFEATLDLAEGENTVTICVADKAGYETSKTIVVDYTPDTEDPVITANVDKGETVYVHEDTFKVEGKVVDAGIGIDVVKINGEVVNVAEDGTFSTEIALKKGANEVTIYVADKAGNDVTYTFTVFYSDKPSIIVINPSVQNGGKVTVKASQITVEGIVAVDNAAGVKVDTVTVNDKPVILIGTYFKGVVDLAEGENTIKVVAKDSTGEEATFTFTVVYYKDTEPPTVELVEPKVDNGGSITVESAELKVAGYAKDNEGVDYVSVNGQVVAVIGGYFETTVQLSEGENDIKIIAVDINGNSTPYKFTAIYKPYKDTEPPTVEIVSPQIPEGMLVYETDQDVVTVKVKATDNGSGIAKVEINGVVADKVSDDVYAAQVKLSEGANVIVAKAYDNFGNEAEAQITVVYDPYLNKVVIELQPGVAYYKINGETKSLDVAPFINDKGRTMVPVRFIAEALGLSIKWDPEKRQVIISGENTDIVLTIDSNIAYVNGVPTKMDSEAVIVDGRTFVPLRFIAEAFGFEVQWNPPVITLIKHL